LGGETGGGGAEAIGEREPTGGGHLERGADSKAVAAGGASAGPSAAVAGDRRDAGKAGDPASVEGAGQDVAGGVDARLERRGILTCGHATANLWIKTEKRRSGFVRQRRGRSERARPAGPSDRTPRITNLRSSG